MSSRPNPSAAATPGGVTLIELCITLAIVGILVAVSVPRLHGSLARYAARAAAADAAHLLSQARHIAATSAEGAAVTFDSVDGRMRLVAGGDTVRTLELAAVHGVRLRATRDSLAYDARGLGYGAANLSVVLTRGTAAETLVVSRLGRLRRSGVP